MALFSSMIPCMAQKAMTCHDYDPPVTPKSGSAHQYDQKTSMIFPSGQNLQSSIGSGCSHDFPMVFPWFWGFPRLFPAPNKLPGLQLGPAPLQVLHLGLRRLFPQGGGQGGLLHQVLLAVKQPPAPLGSWGNSSFKSLVAGPSMMGLVVVNGCEW